VCLATAVAIGLSAGACQRGDASNPGPSPETRVASAPGGAVRLLRSAHPLAQARFDAGLLDPNRRLNQLAIVFQPTPAQIADRDALLAAQLDRRSPSYHKWLTPEQYAARFGADAPTIERTRAWLAGQGLEVHATSRLGTRVTFAGRVADLQSAFHAEFHRYSIGGREHYAMASAPVVPPELSGKILGVHNTHDFQRPRPAIRRSLDPGAICSTGNLACPTGTFGLSPRDWAQIYDVNPLYQTGVTGAPIDGSGVDIAVVGEAAISPSDVEAFRAAYGLPPARLTTVVVPGTGAPLTGTTTDGTGFEAMADIEWAGGIAPGAHVDYVVPGQDVTNLFDAVFYAIEQNVAPILSESFSACELGLSPADADVLGLFGAAANLMGITYVAATGDTGAAGCEVPVLEFPGLYVGQPASLPGVTAVGGTQFPAGAIPIDCSGSVTGYPGMERGWNETTTSAGLMSGGGGTSVVFARPAYQANIPTCTAVGTRPPGTSAGGMRQVPDIAFNSGVRSNPYFMQCTLTKDAAGNVACDPAGGKPTVVPVGGTSLGTPAFAGVLALANHAMGTRLGNVNPELYALSTQAPSAFHDIAAGSNFVRCDPANDEDAGCPTSACPETNIGNFCYGYPAVTGYDCSTGLGSIDVANLVRAWAALPPTTVALAASSTTLPAGTPVTLTATVATNAATPVAGTVTFTTQSQGTIFFEDQGFYDPIFVTADGHVGASFQSRSLGSVTVAGGTASIQAKLPAGMVRPGAQTIDVVASYDGDGQHAASTSTSLRLTLTGVDLCIFGATRAVAPFDVAPFAASSSHGPVSWATAADSTCDEALDCSSIDTNGAFVAGPEPGYVVVAAQDAVGAVALAFVTVGTPSSPPPWGTQTGTECPVGTGLDAGTGDSGPTDDAAPSDSGPGDDVAPGDSGPMDDATLGDSGPTDDAGTGDDASSISDAAVGDDAGDATGDAPPPSGTPDAASRPVEAGFTGYAPLPCAVFDAGPPAETPPFDRGGCGCTSAGSGGASRLGPLALLLAGAASLARRRRRYDAGRSSSSARASRSRKGRPRKASQRAR
jgi:MYXO-CTERM domain-containing protein